jgi:hypothetical protein
MNNQTLNMKDAQYNDLPVLALMTSVLFALKAIWVVLISYGPMVPDELIYKFNASAIFNLQKYAFAVYPPVYPFALAPALFFKHWYESMLVLNAFWSSLIVPVTWFLARCVGIKQPLLAAGLAALLPMHVIYPNILYSENLFVPLFVLAVALALRGGTRGNLEALVFGFVLGIAHLTKYLFLPALPLLFGAWLYSRSKSNREVLSGSLRNLYYPALLVLLAYSLVIGIWLCYGQASGFAWRQLFGLDYSRIETDAANIHSLLMYAVAYTAYVVLAWFPVWGLIVVWAVQTSDKSWRLQRDPSGLRFLALTLMLLGCYWLLAVQHSFGRAYNYPVPQRIVGRYLMQLSPIMLVVGVWVLERLAETQAPFRKMKALISISVLAGLASISWWILFNKGIWRFSGWFYEPHMADVIAFVSLPVFLLAIGMLLLLLGMICFRRNNIRFIVLPIVVFMLVSLVVDARRMHAYQNGLHYREFAYVAASLTGQAGDTLNVFVDGKGSLRTWSGERLWVYARMAFWGLKQEQIFIQNVSTQGISGFTSLSSPTLLLTIERLDIKPLREYIVNDKKYFIYRIDGVDPKVLRPIILTSGKDGK